MAPSFVCLSHPVLPFQLISSNDNNPDNPDRFGAQSGKLANLSSEAITGFPIVITKMTEMSSRKIAIIAQETVEHPYSRKKILVIHRLRVYFMIYIFFFLQYGGKHRGRGRVAAVGMRNERSNHSESVFEWEH